MTSNPFKYEVRDAVSVAAGQVIKLPVSSVDHLRYVWSYYDKTAGSFAAGHQAYIRFTRQSQVVMELPACIVPAANERLGVTPYLDSLVLDSQVMPETMLWNPNDGTGRNYTLQPFRLICDCDEIELIHSTTMTIRAFLGCLSMSTRP
jgi:hypothetical protein